MGILKAMAYSTQMFANLADHTYVECGNGGKGWKCWGGKTGGKELRRGIGSTKRADKIAQPDEKAGIKCYLVNGVCHQAANRILLPAGITVRGARGYSISEALFGTYGRVRFWPCHAPFNKYPTVKGDLLECILSHSKGMEEASFHVRSTSEKLDTQYIKGVLDIYEGAAPAFKSKSLAEGQSADLQLKLFMYMAEFHLGPMLNSRTTKRIMGIREDTEKAILKAQKFLEKRGVLKSEERTIHVDYVEAFNKITIDFQEAMAKSMTVEQYKTLFDLEPEERIILADPRIVS